MCESDVDAVATLHRNAFLSTHTGLLPSAFLSELTERKVADYWQRHLEAKRDAFLASTSDEIIGVVLGGSRRASPPDANVGEIFSLYVDSRLHGQGIGRHLVEELLKSFANRGWHRAIVRVVKGNPAVDFYLRTGAQLVSTQMVNYGSEVAEEVLLEYAEW